MTELTPIIYDVRDKFKHFKNFIDKNIVINLIEKYFSHCHYAYSIKLWSDKFCFLIF